MRNKAQTFRLKPGRLCLVFLLLLSGASQIQAQVSPNSKVETTPAGNKTDVYQTPGTSASDSQSDKTNSNSGLMRVPVETEKTKNNAKQLKPEGASADRKRTDGTIEPENSLTVVVTQDVAEYQLADVKEDENPTESKTTVTYKLFRPVIKTTIENSNLPPAAASPLSDCNWQQITGPDRDPFDAHSQQCYQALTAQPPRDPFLPRALEQDGPGQIQFPNWQNYPFKRNDGGGFDPQWIDWILANASNEGVDPLLLVEVMRWESSFKPGAISPVGAGGLMQFMPATAARFGINPFDERQAIYGGARYIGFLLRKFNGNILSALAGYNAGEGAVEAFLNCRPLRAGNKVINPMGRCTANGIPPYAETQKYAAGIYANYQMSVRRAEGIIDSRQRIAVNVRFKFSNLQAVGIQGRNDRAGDGN